MRNDIRILTALELRNLCGWNVFCHTRDPKARGRYLLLAAVWLLVMAVVWVYVGGLVYGLISLGLGQLAPSYLILLTSLVLLAFGVFQAGGVIFSQKGYDMLCALPVSQTAIVVSRFLRMYVADLLMTVAVMLPGLAVYGYAAQPGIAFWLMAIGSCLLTPILPLVISSLVGAVITAISSRMKRKALVQTVLSVALVVGVLLGSMQMGTLETELTPEVLTTLAGIVSERIGELYPPAVWMGQSLITGKPGGLLLCAVVSLAAGITVIGGIARGFRRICDGLFATTARHDYRMGVLKGRSVMAALWKREQKRYLSSSLYVTNTIVGPLLATILAGAMWMTGVDALQETVDGLLAGSSLSLRVAELIPFLLSAVFCMMTTTSVSISMEGKEFWLIKSLPVSTKMVLDSKILMNLSVMLPFYVVSEILLTLAVRPMLTQWLWQLLIPAVLILFTCVLGITVNLHFYSFDWQREETVVKQSAAALLGGFAGLLVSLLCAVPMILAPQERMGLVKAAICLALSAMTWLLREKNNQTQLQCL